MAQNDLITHFPFGLTSRGMPVIGGGGRETTGSVYFVSSTAPGASNNVNTHGTNPTTPFATLDYAIGACNADKGDLIYLMPGHAETINAASGIDADVSGITIIGLGNGRKRPVFTFAGTTVADMDIDAAGIRIENVVFDFTGVDALIAPIDVNAADFHLINCEIIFASATNQVVGVLRTDSNALRMKILDCYFHGTDNAGAESVIYLDSTTGAEIGNCRIEGTVSQGTPKALIYLDGVLDVYIHHNVLLNRGTSSYGIRNVNVLSTGLIERNAIVVPTLTGGYPLTNLALAAIENFAYDSDTSDENGVPVPIIGNTLANSRSIYDEIIGAEMSYNRVNYLAVTADLTSATWNTVASHEILTVTGAVRVRILPICSGSVTSGGAITGILGTETTTNGMIASTDLTTLDAGMAWLSATPSHLYAKTSVLDFIIANGQDVGYTIGSNAATGGTIVFHVWWEPLNSTGAVAAGAGGAL